MDDQVEPPEVYVKLAQASQATHRTIAALAAAKVARDDVRSRPDYSANQMMMVAKTYRTIEGQLEQVIDAEMNAHIAVLDYELTKGSEDAQATTDSNRIDDVPPAC